MQGKNKRKMVEKSEEKINRQILDAYIKYVKLKECKGERNAEYEMFKYAYLCGVNNKRQKKPAD